MQNIHCWESKFEPCVYSSRLLTKVEDLNKVNFPKVDIKEVKKAIYYARKYHDGQFRKSGEPFYTHPLEVAYMVADYAAKKVPHYFTTEILISSILHDCIEDTELTKEMVCILFGDVVANQVYDLTRIKEDSFKISSAEMIDRLFREKKYSVLFIKQFDRLHNIQTICSKSSKKRKKIIEETLKNFLLFSEMIDLPWLCDMLYEECYKQNQKLNEKQPSFIVFDKQLNLSDIPFFQNKTPL